MDIFGAIASRFVKIRSEVIDNHAFRLHYRITTALLIAMSILVTSRQYLGDPIDCLSQSSSIPSNIMDQYCWISTTFTLPSVQTGVGIDIPFPGIDTSSHHPHEKTYHQYYQWVCFVLFLQAVMFYFPHYLWKMWEGGRIKSLSSGLEFTLGEDVDKIAQVVDYLRQNLGNNNLYFTKYVFCEFLNLVNVIGQIYFTNKFLGGAFVTYGADVIKYSEMNQENRTDPMVQVFPRVTKCTFHTFGPSGDVQKHDSLCILPINIINEKIYIFLWFWLIMLATVSASAIVYRLLTTLIPKFRYLLLKLQSRFTAREFVERTNDKCQVGDWFLLYLLGQSIDVRKFAKIINDLAKSASETSTVV